MSDNLYLIEIEYEYHGVPFEEMTKLLLEELDFYLTEQDGGGAKHLYKAAGERKLYIIMEKSAQEVDAMLLSTPLAKKVGDQTKITVTELLQYETFANAINKMTKRDKVYQVGPLVERKAPHFFWVVFNLGYEGHSLGEFLDMWCEEVEAGLGAKTRGMVVDIWKCVGRREGVTLMNFECIEQLDQVLSFRLPILKRNGQNVRVNVKAVRDFESLAVHLKELVGVEK